MELIPNKYRNIYKIKNRAITPENWSGDDDNKIIEYYIDVDLINYKNFSLDDFNKYIIKELTNLKILIPENNKSFKFSFFSQHWEPDDCSLYIRVYLEYNETEKQKKLRKQLDKTMGV